MIFLRALSGSNFPIKGFNSPKSSITGTFQLKQKRPQIEIAFLRFSEINPYAGSA